LGALVFPVLFDTENNGFISLFDSINIGAMACGVNIELHLPPVARGFAGIMVSVSAMVGFVLWKS
jgi:hypothetical protein